MGPISFWLTSTAVRGGAVVVVVAALVPADSSDSADSADPPSSSPEHPTAEATRTSATANSRPPICDLPPGSRAVFYHDPAAGSGGIELEVELLEATQDPGGLVAEVAVARWAVVLLGQSDVARPGEDALQADPALGPGEGPTGARVDPPP